MTFMPLIIAGFYHILFGDKKKWYYLVAGFTGVLQSHVLSTLIVSIIFAIACVLWIRGLFSDKRWIQLFKAAVTTILLNLWFIVPFLFFYMKENLSFESLNWSSYEEYSVNPSFFFETIDTGSNRYLSFGLPVMCMVGVCIISLVSDKTRNSINSYLKYIFAAGCVLSFMITGYFDSWEFMEIGIFDKLFTTIQFPWRLFGIAAILFIFAGCVWLSISRVLDRYVNAIVVVLTVICILSGLNTPYNSNNFAYYKNTDTHTSGHADKITGIIKSDASIIEPYEWRIDYLEDANVSTEPSSSNTDRVDIVSFEKNGTKAQITYSAQGDGQYIEFPIMNYIGYVASDEDGDKLAIETGNNSRLRVWVKGDGVEHVINVKYQIPLSFRIATLVSAASYMFVLFWSVRIRKDHQKQ